MQVIEEESEYGSEWESSVVEPQPNESVIPQEPEVPKEHLAAQLAQKFPHIFNEVEEEEKVAQNEPETQMDYA